MEEPSDGRHEKQKLGRCGRGQIYLALGNGWTALGYIDPINIKNNIGFYFQKIEFIYLLLVYKKRKLIPTLFLILDLGYQPERLQDGMYFLSYTLLVGIFCIYYFVQLKYL